MKNQHQRGGKCCLPLIPFYGVDRGRKQEKLFNQVLQGQ